MLPENRVHSRCSWETYERLLLENHNASAPRFTFDQGWLEIMSPSLEHERINGRLKSLVAALAGHFRRDWLDTGSTTFRRQNAQRGFEPDSSYYFAHAARMRQVEEVDLSLHPAPELVIEIDLSRSSYDKLELYRALGVAEVWRWVADELHFYVLGDHGFQEVTHSLVFPPVSAQAIAQQVRAGAQLTATAWQEAIEAWMRAL